MPNQQRGIRNYQSEDLLKAWKEGVAEVSRSPKLLREIERHEGKLLPRFAEQYERLRKLPRRVRRAVQRKWRHTLAGVALLMALGVGSAAATTFNVPCPGGVGDNAALIQAINDSNDEVANPGADTIILVSNCTHTLTAVDNNTFLDTGLPVINSEIMIDGNGSTIERDSGMGTPDFRIFAINEDGNLTLLETTVSGGVASGIFPYDRGGGVLNYGILTLTEATISGNSASNVGGGVENDGTLSITNSTISGNSASGFGGGVFNNDTLIITNSTISDNSAQFGGGVLNAEGSTANLTDSTISGNSASGFGGGGVYNLFYATLTLTNSTISDNSAQNAGGGVFNSGGTATLINSTISGNSAQNIGGGVFNSSFFTYNYDHIPGTLTLTNSTISGNSASNGGGGVFNNTYALLILNRTLISGNTASTGPEINNQDDVTANNFNLFGYSSDDGVTGFTPGATDMVPGVELNAILDTALADNGGSTQTHALVSGSPALDAVTTGCPPPATDQRGVTRPQGTRCDIGAFELQSSPIATPTPTPTSTATPTPAATPTPGPPDRGSNGSSGCSIAQSLESGSALTNLLLPLLPIFAFGVKYLRRKLE
jgi:hypothetical protein